MNLISIDIAAGPFRMASLTISSATISPGSCWRVLPARLTVIELPHQDVAEASQILRPAFRVPDLAFHEWPEVREAPRPASQRRIDLFVRHRAIHVEFT